MHHIFRFVEVLLSCWSFCHFVSLGMCTQVLSHSRQDPLHYRLRQVDMLHRVANEKACWEWCTSTVVHVFAMAGRRSDHTVGPTGLRHLTCETSPCKSSSFLFGTGQFPQVMAPLSHHLNARSSCVALPHTGSKHLWNHIHENEIWWDEMMTPSLAGYRTVVPIPKKPLMMYCHVSTRALFAPAPSEAFGPWCPSPGWTSKWTSLRHPITQRQF